MPSDRNTAYPFLEQMRTEELEALLQQEFTAADGGERTWTTSWRLWR